MVERTKSRFLPTTRLSSAGPVAALAALALAAASCARPAPAPEVGTVSQAIFSPQPGAPPLPWVVLVKVKAGLISPVEDECFGTRVSPRYVLTAATCFDAVDPNDETGASVHVDNTFVPKSAVRFHPSAWANGAETWTEFLGGVGLGSVDAALIEFEDAQAPVAHVWHPPAGTSLVGRQVFFGGSGGTGEETLTAKAGNHWKGDVSPSGLQKKDTGGGAFLELTADLPPSLPFATGCPTTLLAGQVGDLVLVGLGRSANEFAAPSDEDLFLDVTNPKVIEWVAKVTHADKDGDNVCDAEDLCADVPDDQANCNRDAETAFAAQGLASMVKLGDQCDPAPCPRPALEFREFNGGPQLVPIPGGPGDVVLSKQYGRDINDDLSVTPILEVSSDPGGDVQPRFCQCPNVEPLLCRGFPWFCEIDPRLIDDTEIGFPTVPVLGETLWHKVSLGEQAPVLGAPIPVNGYPGDKATARWDYNLDFDAWTALGWLAPPPPPDPLAPAGTDLVGVLWAHDDTTTGASTHGLFCAIPPGPTDVCSIADAYSVVAPDPVAQSDWGYELPATAPPNFAFCDSCGDAVSFPGDHVFEPAPFLTPRPGSLAVSLWLADRGGRDATPLLSQNLRASLSDASVLWVSPSEPVNITNSPSFARALLLSADGTELVDTMHLDASGFSLARADGRGLPGGELAAAAAVQGPPAREGFAAAWSRTAGALYVLGGRDPATHAVVPVASSWRPGAGWSSVALDPAHAPRKALAATFSPRDWRIWVLDERGPGKRHLLRIDGETGHVETDIKLGALSAFKQMWLTTLEDGRVVFVGTKNGLYVVALLSSRPFADPAELSVDGAHFGLGKVVLPPVVRFGKISLALEKKHKGKAVGITPIIVKPGGCNASWGELSNALP